MPVDTRLIQYLQAEFAKGYAKEQIRLALTQSGYLPADIDAAFAQLSNDATGASTLAQSIARTGVAQTQAQDQLLKAGYTPATARRATRDVYGAPASAPSSSVHTIVFAIIALIIGAGGMWLLLEQSDGTPTDNTPAVSVSFAPAEIIAQVLEVARSQGTDAGVSACKQRLSGRDRDLCILDIAILPEVADMTLCDQVADVQYADACYLNFLGDERNVAAVCAKIKLAENRDTCDAIIRLRPIQPSV